LAQGAVSAAQLSALVAQSIQDQVVELAPGRFGGALHREPEGKQAAGGVVILHRAGAEPNQRGVIRALRVGLPREGWHTVSVQLEPVLGPLGQWHEGVSRRLSAAVKYFTAQAVSNVVILAQGSAAGGAAAYFIGGADAAVTGFVGLSAVYSDHRTDLGEGSLSKAWPKRILELVGQRDYASVLHAASEHKRQSGEVPELSLRQVRIPFARNGFRGHETLVVRRVNGWLRRHLAGHPASAEKP
jgi:hypothetical protein